MFRSHHSRVLTLAAGAAFLALLDVTVVNLAIPALGRADPSASVTSLSWVITAYATLFAALLAPAGRLADVVGRRRLYRVGVGGFAGLSLVCALSPSIPVLLATRAVQGAFAATMIPASLAILPTSPLSDAVTRWRCGAPPARSPPPSVRAWAACSSTPSAGARCLSSTSPPGWPWPPGRASCRGRPPPRTRLPDALGTVLLACGIGSDRARTVAGVRVGPGATPAPSRASSAASPGRWLRSSARGGCRSPRFDTSLWKHLGCSRGPTGGSLLYGASLYAWMLLGVLVLTELWHYSELQAGLANDAGGDRRQRLGRGGGASRHPADGGGRRGGADGRLRPVHRVRPSRPTESSSTYWLPDRARCSARAWAW